MATLVTNAPTVAQPVELSAPRSDLAPTPPAAPSRSEKPARLVSLDAYRGFIMLAMASSGLAIPRVAAQHFRDSPVWQFFAGQLEHVPWIGCSFWDLIQPSFMFMVGVALPYSCASRKARGDSDARMFVHVAYRSLVLILLGVFLSSNWDQHTNYTFVNVLTQIGLGYTFVYLLLGRGLRVQLLALAVILVGYWLAFALYPLTDPGFDRAILLAQGQELPGFFAHWSKNTNIAADADFWLLNLFPRPDLFLFNNGGYQTLNFVPSLATMILGLIAGERLRGKRGAWDNFTWLVAAGSVCIIVGWVAGQTVCPLVKRIWTPSWAVYSAGWTFWLLAAFFGVIDLAGYRRWAFPFVVVGMNSIAMYCMAQLLKPWVSNTFKIHLGRDIFAGTYGPIMEASAFLLVLWLVCLWLYRRGIFLRV
jgi:predicted acyltransferase